MAVPRSLEAALLLAQVQWELLDFLSGFLRAGERGLAVVVLLLTVTNPTPLALPPLAHEASLGDAEAQEALQAAFATRRPQRLLHAQGPSTSPLWLLLPLGFSLLTEGAAMPDKQESSSHEEVLH